MASTPSTRLLLLLALCVLPALVTAGSLGFRPFRVIGNVYCDTCRCGFETSATTYIAGARVRLECRDRKTLQLLYTSVEGVTNSTGTYDILVEDDHQDQICETVLVGSPLSSCQLADPGRARANIIVTRYNGVLNDIRFANAMGFLRDQALPGCTQLLKKYLESDDQ
ncbi:protein DOWNSTREAM OF FLC-like [Juglans microcarpa x Juglans regia]|uniref:protein DOWNSTREAM OF FLC-like n=1 Tax=Juglans microcarpa x Juglans regia TaxID=2249226 RepID=UPI001B7E02DE|nr:protein DOWNSTREAM OF FLC-like [Juglans microcarpa x Juglans regia]